MEGFSSVAATKLGSFLSRDAEIVLQAPLPLQRANKKKRSIKKPLQRPEQHYFWHFLTFTFYRLRVKSIKFYKRESFNDDIISNNEHGKEYRIAGGCGKYSEIAHPSPM